MFISGKKPINKHATLFSREHVIIDKQIPPRPPKK